MAVVLGDAVAYLVLDSSQFDSAISKAASALSEFEITSGDSWKALGSGLTSLGSSLTRGITLPLGMAAKDVISFGADFEKQMSNVQSVSNATSEEMDQMEEAAIRWGEKTVYTATEAGDALYYMGLAGWDVQDSISALGPVLNLAAAGQLDLGRTSDIVTDAMTAMGMEADKTTNGLNNATYFTNTLAAAMSNSNTTVDMMGETFKYVAPLAGSLGFTIDDLALATGLMANVGVKASQAGTGLRQALKQLISPSKTAAAAMQKYDISLDDGTGNAKNFRQLMEELRSTFGGLNVDIYDASGELKTGEQIMEEYGDSLPLSQMEKLQAVTDIFGIRALPGMLGIIQQSEEKFNQLADAIDNSSQAFVANGNEVYTMAEAYEKFGDDIYDTSKGFEILGAAEGMARMQMDNLAGDWTRFTSALGTTKIILSKIVNEELRALVQKLTDIVIWFNNLDEAHQKLIVKIAGFAAALGPVLIVVGKLFTAIGSIMNVTKDLVTTFKGVKTVMQAASMGGAEVTGAFEGVLKIFSAIVAHPFIAGAVVAAIAAIVAAVVDLWRNNEDFRNSVMEAWNAIWDLLKSLWEAIGPVLKLVIEIFGEIVKAIEPLVLALVQALAPAIKGAAEALAPLIKLLGHIIEALLEIAGPIIVAIVQAISGLISLIGGPLLSIVTGLIKFVYELIGAFFEFVDSILGPVLSGLKSFWEDCKSLFEGTTEVILGVISAFVKGIVGFFEWLKYVLIGDPIVLDLLNGIGKAFKEGFEFVYNLVKDIIYGIVDFFKWLSESALSLINSFVEHFHNSFVNVGDAIKKLFEGIKDTVVGFANKLIETAKNIGKDFADGILGGARNAAEFFGNFISTAIDTLLGAVGKFKDAGAKLINSFWEGLKSVWDSVVGWIKDAIGGIQETIQNIVDGIKNIVSSIKDTAMNIKDRAKSWINGSHANGLEYVPYDGYIAELHQGERVLTRSENQQYSSGNGGASGGGDVYNFYNTQSDPYEIARQVRRTKKELAFAQ